MSTVLLDPKTDTVVLPVPAWPTGAEATLEHALKSRHSTREFEPEPLPLGTLSTLLWCAFGVNRRSSGGRTAPSAHGWREIDLYAVLAEGAYRYDPLQHRLLLARAEDLRALTGVQEFVGHAPLGLVYVADVARMDGLVPMERDFFIGADAAFAAQNAYLYCAAAGLGAVVRAMIDRNRLAQALNLAPTQRIALAQTIGLPRR